MQSRNATALELLTHTIGWSLSSICELEVIQAHLHKTPRREGAKQPAQGRPPLLFIAPRAKRRCPFTGQKSGALDASTLRRQTCHPSVERSPSIHMSLAKLNHCRKRLTHMCAWHIHTERSNKPHRTLSLSTRHYLEGYVSDGWTLDVPQRPTCTPCETLRNATCVRCSDASDVPTTHGDMRSLATLCRMQV